jgi:hypothetical protein
MFSSETNKGWRRRNLRRRGAYRNRRKHGKKERAAKIAAKAKKQQNVAQHHKNLRTLHQKEKREQAERQIEHDRKIRQADFLKAKHEHLKAKAKEGLLKKKTELNLKAAYKKVNEYLSKPIDLTRH